jgi:hypothetical protein
VELGYKMVFDLLLAGRGGVLVDVDATEDDYEWQKKQKSQSMHEALTTPSPESVARTNSLTAPQAPLKSCIQPVTNSLLSKLGFCTHGIAQRWLKCLVRSHLFVTTPSDSSRIKRRILLASVLSPRALAA